MVCLIMTSFQVISKNKLNIFLKQLQGRILLASLSDTFFLFAVDMAEELHSPWVPLWTSEPRSLPFLLESDLVR
ncbi:hypothetical protein NC652_016983 [Populus alba x Populus x berolinensis]|nr:hypothetical protein NC652_016983 [Populus alba x Populus x berolinensis]